MQVIGCKRLLFIVLWEPYMKSQASLVSGMKRLFLFIYQDLEKLTN